MSLVSWVLSHLRPYRGRVSAIAVVAIAEVGLAALAPWPLQVLVDNVLGGHPLPAPLAGLVDAVAGGSTLALLVAVVMAGLLIQVAGEAARMINTQLQVDMGQRLVYDLRARLLAHLQALPLRHHVLGTAADSVYRLEADAHCVDDLAIGGLFPVMVAGLNLAVMFGILAWLDVTIALLALTVAPLLYICLRYYSATLTVRAERVKALESSLLEQAFDILSRVAAVKSFTRERHELTRFSRGGQETMRARLALTWQESLFSVVVTAITLAGTALVLIVGGMRVLDGTLTVGTLLVVIAYLAAVYAPLSAIAHTAGSLQQAIVSARRVRETLALAPERLDDPEAMDASAVTGLVHFENVSFSYDGVRTVLDDISFEARPGEVIALVGLTGAGKTTLTNLIPRFYEPTRGRILIDGVEAQRYALRSLRERIALVPQDPVLLRGTIADNIRYGRLQASDDDVRAAARAAHVDEFVQRLPAGYETRVEEAGATLSGGERQRIGIARALLKNAPLLILDEPTSSVDALSEAAIFDALRSLRRGRTTIVIAHRLSTVRDATRILVLHEGRLIAQGTHDELLVSTELYRRLWARFAGGPSDGRLEPPRGSTSDALDDAHAAGAGSRP